jgi:hypothetical protein
MANCFAIFIREEKNFPKTIKVLIQEQIKKIKKGNETL